MSDTFLMYIKQLKYSCHLIYNLFSENQYSVKTIYLPKALLKSQDRSKVLQFGLKTWPWVQNLPFICFMALDIWLVLLFSLCVFEIRQCKFTLWRRHNVMKTLSVLSFTFWVFCIVDLRKPCLALPTYTKNIAFFFVCRSNIWWQKKIGL